jgi:hypothetical protein
MTVSQKIEKQISQIPEGRVFGYRDMVLESDEYGAATKSLGRLVEAGQLKRATKGVYYKPQQTIFGTILPQDEELLKRYLFKNGQRIAYITGLGLYNTMGLTTQFPFIITLASKARRANLVVIGNIKIKPVRSYAVVTNDNYVLLEILDALKDFRIIPDIDRQSATKLLTAKLQTLTSKQTEGLIKYALNYPPRVCAFLGAMLEMIDNSLNLNELRTKINPLSKYKMGITTNILPNSLKWNLT